MMDTETLHVHAEGHRDDQGAKLGMWIFLFTEMFFFGGLFLVYAVYRVMYPVDFHGAAQHLNVTIGSLNTVLLITSSMTLSMALVAVQRNHRNLAKNLIGVTILLAVFFLINKFFEWDHKILVNLYPGSDLMLSLKHGYTLFFGLYFFMTGLHALHLIIGVVLMTICWFKVNSGAINSDRHVLLVNSTLYWHLVDLIWIFLFPLLYLLH
jgi:cytochrome c oxidase subunit III